MCKFIIRLDDACEKRDIDRWNEVEKNRHKNASF